MKKKADFGARTLVTIILTVLGFVILLIFLTNALSFGKFDKEACHQSVILRGTVPNVVESYVPLNCKTEKICITTKLLGGKCEDFENSKGVTYVRVSKEEHIEKAIAESMVDCWSMMGEGKLSLFQQYFAENVGLGTVYPSCVICSRIAFDKEALIKGKIDLSKINVEEYMATHAIGEEEISYLDFIAGETNAKITLADNLVIPNITQTVNEKGETIIVNNPGATNQNDVLLSAGEIEAKKIEDQSFEKQTDEIAVLFMQISAPKHGESLINLGKTMVGGGIAVGSTVGFLNTGKVLIKAGRLGVNACKNPVGGTICAGVALAAIFYQQSNVAANRNIAAGKCSDVVLGNDAREGCSVVRTVNYDEESISAYCSVVESSK